MDSITFLIVITTAISWGVGSFVAKLATNRIGNQGVFWDVIAYALVIIIYGLIVFKFENLSQIARTNKLGILLAFLAGLMSSLGMIGYYVLLTRAEASTIVPFTALYPVITITLAIIFLRESLTTTKLLGIILSLIAVYFLSK